MSIVMVVAVHPDDETLGAGATLLKHKANGDELIWVIGTSMPKNDYSSKMIKDRDAEIKTVGKAYGFKEIVQLNFPAAHLDELGTKEIVSSLSAVIQKLKPEVIYLPFAGDAHSDHKIIFDAAHGCLKTFRSPFVKKIYAMETISETEFGAKPGGPVFVPNYFVDTSDYLDQKIKIMKIYKGEIGQHPFPRSEENIRSLATFRGVMAHCRFAESFMLIKEIA